ncbi:UDP-3-O-(3-hydroxymyristoyl)glucosamine N-acyltransferase [Zavarzinia sp. CC-PAN008]|uniref:UDP-3-O-(3-hydroxymyristoyl)glucosamine N-acyltransferase n=1 Tax=Zavarzinia sp. CC-PAN008 TaxID=3243332 RepID=UPI003F744656
MSDGATGPAFRLDTLAALIGAELVGAPAMIVRGISPPHLAGPEHLAIAIEPGAVAALGRGTARAALLVAGTAMPEGLKAALLVSHGRVGFARATQAFAPVEGAPGIDPSAVIAPDAVLAEGVCVGALAVIGAGAEIGPGTIVMAQATIGPAARLGADCVVHSGARIGARVVLGDRVRVFANAVLGAEGFSYVTVEPNAVDRQRGAKAAAHPSAGGQRPVAVRSLGTVIVGDDVDVGACTTIDRATLDATRIGSGTKLDDHVHVGHNCRIGRDGLICGMVGLSGSVVIGDRVVLAGGVGVADHVSIGDDVLVLGGSGVAGDIPAGSVYGGYPAAPQAEKVRELMNLKRIERLLREVQDLKSRLARVERTPGQAGSGGEDRTGSNG